MTQQHVALWRQAAEAFDQRYQAVQAEQMEASTPCANWNVKQLIDHAVNTQAQFAGPLVGAEIAEGAEWPQVYQAINAAIEDPSVLEGMIDDPNMGTVPKVQNFGIATSDMLIHTWDVAKAIGGDTELPAEAVQACHTGMQHFPEEMMRSEGMFGAKVECAADADVQTQMLSHAGRDCSI